MIKVDIICGEFNMINGANRVTEKLIYGYERFKDNDIELRTLINNDGFVDCKTYQSQLGSYTVNYTKKRSAIQKLKKLPVYRTYFIQAMMQLLAIRRSKKSVKNYLSGNFNSDCIIFQDVFSGYYFLKLVKNERPKILVITHADTDPMEQLLINRPELKGTIIENIIRKKYNKVIRGADKVVTICHSSQDYIAKNNEIESACILNGIEDITMRRSHPFTIEKGRINIVVLGSVIYRKGHDLIVQAVSHLSEKEKSRIKVHIIGNGNAYTNIKNQISNENLDEYFKLYGELNNVTDLLSKMDVMLLPSRAEAVPIAIIEGLRSGLPVISTSVGEIPFMIENCGILIEPNVESVLIAIQSLISGKFDIEKLSQRARERYEKEFTLNKMIDNYSFEINKLFK